MSTLTSLPEYIPVPSLLVGVITSAVVGFFKDLTQIIQIVLQVGMWATPILWDISMLTDQIKPLFKLQYKW